MPTLVKIGFDYYLVRSAAAGVKIVDGLSDCIRLRSDHHSLPKYSLDGFQPEIGIQQVNESQLLLPKPDNAKRSAQTPNPKS